MGMVGNLLRFRLSIFGDDIIFFISIVVLVISHFGNYFSVGLFVFVGLIGFELIAPHPGHQFGNRLGEIHFNSPVIDWDVIHFQVGFFTGFGAFVLNEGVLKTLTCLPVPYDLHAFDWPEPGEN